MRTSTRTGAEPPSRSISRSCKRAQQFRLQTDVHFGNFVEQQGAAMGCLELAEAAGDGAGKGTFFVAEQFGFQQVFRDRGAVQCDERAAGAARFAMDVAGQHFLAGARIRR